SFTFASSMSTPSLHDALPILRIVPCELRCVATQAIGRDRDPSDGTTKLENGQLPCFSEVPRPGDALFMGLSIAVPSCAVLLRFRSEEHTSELQSPDHLVSRPL